MAAVAELRRREREQLTVARCTARRGSADDHRQRTPEADLAG